MIELERRQALDKDDTLYGLRLHKMYYVATVRRGQRKRPHPGVRKELARQLLRHIAKELGVKANITINGKE